jgi:hypothetical protein
LAFWKRDRVNRGVALYISIAILGVVITSLGTSEYLVLNDLNGLLQIGVGVVAMATGVLGFRRLKQPSGQESKMIATPGEKPALRRWMMVLVAVGACESVAVVLNPSLFPLFIVVGGVVGAASGYLIVLRPRHQRRFPLP